MADIAALQAAYNQARANAEAALQASIAAEERVEASKAAVQPYTDAVVNELGPNASDDDIRERLIEILPEEILREVQESQEEESVLTDEAIAAAENAMAAKAALDAAANAPVVGGARRIYRKSRKSRKSRKNKKTRKSPRNNRANRS